MGFGYILLHFSLYFGTYCIPFWCKIHCVLVHIALRFGAKCTAFCCKMRCVLLQNALRFAAKCDAFCCKMRCNNQRLGTIFLSFRMQIWGGFFFKEKCKNIVNGQKRRG